MLSTLADDSITLHYQPLVKSAGEVVGFEALMRWHHQKRGQISPEAFIPIFENCGMILALSRWALRQACTDAASWRRPLLVSVNVSPVQFTQDDLPALVAEVLEHTGLAPERLQLEITEAALVDDPQGAGVVLRKLAAQGVKLAFDNAGAGVALPFFLSDYPFSRIKIARDVVENIETSEAARSIIHMILLVGRSMGVPVTAKGVETGAQLAYLMDQGCDLLQGFLLGRPGPISSFAALTGNGPDPLISTPGRRPQGHQLMLSTADVLPFRAHL